jgi:hypothetical protein
LLKPGGVTAHWFATLYALPFFANRLFPERLSGRLLSIVSPREREMHGKFPAYYDWSRGPTRPMVQRFQSLGFDVIRYTGYFGHGYYAHLLPWVDRLEHLKARFLTRHPNPWACSYAYIVLRKPVAIVSG